MLKELLKNKEFLKVIKEFLNKPEILDIILFGSVLKGKEEPSDIDVLIVYSKGFKGIAEKNYELRKKIERIIKNVDINGKEYSGIFRADFLARESILSEGFSLREGKFISELFGYRNFVLFKYSLEKMNKSRRMIFYYSLHGRNKEGGLLKKYNCYKFSDTIILCPPESHEVLKSFFEKNNIKYTDTPILIPDRFAKYNINK